MTPRVRLYACIEAANHHCTIAQVVGQARSAHIVYARHAVMRRLHADGFSMSQIGRWMHRDHSTVHNAVRKVRAG